MHKFFSHAGIAFLIAAAMVAPTAATNLTSPSVEKSLNAAAVPVANVCGSAGCAPVQTKRIIHHQKPGNTAPHHI
jgi:hypothetical protein